MIAWSPTLMRLFLSTAVLAMAAPCLAQATTVYPGCAVPSVKAGHHTFYIDPVKGAANGDGSATKPWRTLAEVLDPSSKLIASKAHNGRTFAKGDNTLSDVNPNGPIKPGDTLMLMSGNHGNVKILNLYNPDFVTVTAAPGQTPIVSSLTLLSAGKWMFQGIKFQGASPAPTPVQLSNKAIDQLIDIGRGAWLGETADIVFDSDSMSTTDDTSGWSTFDRFAKPYYYGAMVVGDTSCTAFTNNHFYNLLNGIALGGTNSLFDKNLLEGMSNDGVDVTTSNVRITRNLIRNGTNATMSVLHPDGIQGWSTATNGVLNTNRNVLIDSNTILKTGDPNDGIMQGISIFDGKWDNLTVTNNVVVDNTWHGIAVYGAQNSKIINNTVIASDPQQHPSWILVRQSKDNQQNPTGTIVRNNISNQLIVGGSGVTADHNIAALRISMPVGGKALTIQKGVLGTQNVITPGILTQFFSNDPKTQSFDLRLRNGSTALGFGVTDGAPPIDIDGARRTPWVSAGAYNQ